MMDYYEIRKEQFAGLRPDCTWKIVPTPTDCILEIARDMADTIRACQQQGRLAVFIIPLGGGLKFGLLARYFNCEGVSWRNVVSIDMDEHVTGDGKDIPLDDPICMRAAVQRGLISEFDPDKRPLPENVIFPSASCPEAIGKRIEELGGVDVVYAPFGINGHIAFNEPPEPEEVSSDVYRNLPTRVLSISRETKTAIALTGTKGNFDLIPPKGVTVGMREILASRKLHCFFMRPHSPGVLRKVLFGPVTPACPGSFVQGHPNVHVTLTEEAAQLPRIGG